MLERFVEHEIDLELFKTLTENDLRDLGIHAFGVRRRMLLTIAGIKESSYKIISKYLFIFQRRVEQEDCVFW